MSVSSVWSSAQSSAATPAAAETSLKKEDFLKLLVTQLQYQDPLNPMESSDFSAQLAQFSSLEQLQNISVQLESAAETDILMARAINNTMAATLIGKEVYAADDRVILKDSSSADINFDAPEGCQSVTIEIYDYYSNKVASWTESQTDAGMTGLVWNGRDQLNRRLPPGEYQVKITAALSNGQTQSLLPLARGTVQGVRYVDGNPTLQIGGREVGFGSVVQINDPVKKSETENWLLRMLVNEP